MYREVIFHHGIKGPKWGVRRYQNEDGSLTDAGKRRHEENADSRRLAQTMSEYINAYADYLDKSKDVYFTENGKQAFRADGSPMVVHIEPGKEKKEWQKYTQKYLQLKNAMQRKYSEVIADANLSDQDVSRLSVSLKDKYGKIYVTELETKYNANFSRTGWSELYKKG